MTNGPTTINVRPSALTIISQLVLILAGLTVVARIAFDLLRPPPPPPPAPKVGGMTWTSYATNNAASFAFTNLTTETRVACVKGVVTALESGISIDSLPICSGEMKPNTSVRIEASWPKGSPDDICFERSQYGKRLDWSKCKFTSQEVQPAGGTPVANAAASD